MRCWIEVSRGRLAANFEAIRQLAGPAVEVCPVVKADAYGHGAIEVSRVLAAAGARWVAVSSVEEGLALRDAGLRTRILVMADLPAADAVRNNLTLAIHDLASLPALARLTPAGMRLPYHLKIDSGMGRLGTRATPADVARAVAAHAATLELEGIMTHFASAANYDTGQTEAQLARFAEVLAALPARPRYVHTSATVPVAYARRGAWNDMIRPGHAIYGYVSPIVRGAAPARELDVQPALAWKARLLTVKDIPAGEPIGYGAMHRAAAPMRIGIVAAGYADGIPHRLGNKGSVIAGGRVVPMVGAVSMDVSTIDLTGVPQAAPGDTVTLLGEEDGARIDAQQIARLAGTISYSVLCGISARVAHVYVG
ncbi:MAG: alanine racemase [Bryobacterales bacterium]|nr:alanine racemase [Bryobacterales bacterium]